jgi:hypothetical protein
MVEDTTRLEFPRSGVATVPLIPPDALICCAAAGPGGHALTVMLDTGTDPSAIDARLAQRLALRTGGSGLGQGAASDEVPFTEAVLPWLKIGDLTIRDLFAPALDLSWLPFRVDLVLGYNVLRQLSLQVDFRARRLTLAHPDISTSVQGVTLPLTFFEHFPAIADLEIDGHRIPIATLDTGSNGALTVGPDLAADLGLRPDAAGTMVAHAAGFGGARAVVQRCGSRLRLGPFTIDDVDLDARMGDGGDLGRPGRANIGTRLLARFAAVALDYERGTLTLDRE